MDKTTNQRRTRGQADKDRDALDAIAQILDEPLNCSRSHLAEADAETLAKISAVIRGVR